jgi:hypothetical protein
MEVGRRYKDGEMGWGGVKWMDCFKIRTSGELL